MLIYCIYKHTSPSGKSYIGLTKNYNRRSRLHRHPSSGCRLFKAAIDKYGWDAFTHEILFSNISLDDANRLETELIIEHNTLAPHGYNLTNGGTARVISDETRQKMSESRRGYTPSAEARQKMSESRRGKSRRPHTEESKRLMSLAKIGKHRSEDLKRKMAAAAAAIHAMTWEVTDPDGNKFIIVNLAEFCRNNNLLPQRMNDVAKGKQKAHKGWKCAYIN